MSSAFGTTLPPVQRAISELAKEGILQSKDRSGVFVAEAVRKSSDCVPLHQIRNIKVGVYSSMPQQMNFWRSASDWFEGQYSNIRISVEQITEDNKDSFDIREIDANELSNPETPAQFQNIAPVFDSEEALYFEPSISNIHCLYYNPELLKKLNLPEPDFSDFQSQCDYFDLCLDAIEQAADNSLTCGYNLSLNLWLGKYQDIIADAIEKKAELAPTDKQKVTDGIKWLLRFRKRIRALQRSSSGELADDSNYESGQLVLWGGYSYMEQALAEKQPLMGRHSHPTFMLDDSVPASSVYLGVCSKTDYILECARFLIALSSPQITSLAWKTDNIPAGISDSSSSGKFNSPAWKNASQKISNVTCPGGSQYIQTYLINDELWNASLHNTSAEDTLNNIFKSGEVYTSLTKLKVQ
jgi:hypothetical protein